MPLNFNFDDGIREYTINNDPNRVIKINVTDYAIIDRFRKAEVAVENFIKDNKETEDNEKFLTEIKDFIYGQINYIFNAEVAEIVFNGANPMSTVGGEAIYEKFLNAIMPVIEESFNEELKKSDERMKKYEDIAKKFE